MPELLEIVVMIAAFFIALTVFIVETTGWLYRTVYNFMWERNHNA